MLRKLLILLLSTFFQIFAEEASSVVQENNTEQDTLIIFDGSSTETEDFSSSSTTIADSEFSKDTSNLKSNSEKLQNDSLASTTSDTQNEKSSTDNKFYWSFSNIIQPILNAAVYPIAAPIHYTVKNNVVETIVEAITFGKDRNIFIYPTFNLKPGASTLIGFSYRHRNLLFDRDYFYAGENYYANGDFSIDTRYTKRNLFGSEFVGGGRFQYIADRNASLALPRTLSIDEKNESYLYTDSSYKFSYRFGRPLPLFNNMSFEIESGFNNYHFSYPDVEDTILTNHPKFNPYDRGMYQDFYILPFKFTVTYDNLDAPYIPTTGSRISLTYSYNEVSDYKGINTKDRSNEYSHDFETMDLTFQHYFFLGRDTKAYSLSASEARKNRNFYTDFSWDETLRLWRPENIKSTLLDRRVLALQFRARYMWEKEKGGVPFLAFSEITGRYPLRGYSYPFADYFTMGLSLEYRWPIDRLVDGVIFNEYATYNRNWHSFDSDKLLNSWGLGVRVRRPDMYFFRLQLGFHGIHGVSFICTIAPEFR